MATASMLRALLQTAQSFRTHRPAPARRATHSHPPRGNPNRVASTGRLASVTSTSGDGPMLAMELRIAPTVCGCISDGVPPPKDRRDLAAGALRRGFDLALEGAGKAEFVNRRVADMAVEVAIRTLRQAERPVHVDAKSFFRAAAHVRHISASFTKAFARWERPMPCGGRPCFSMLVISPKVRL